MDKCFICNNKIKYHIYKAYDKSLCSSLCRNNLINHNKYDHNYNIVSNEEFHKRIDINELKYSKNKPNISYNNYSHNIDISDNIIYSKNDRKHLHKEIFDKIKNTLHCVSSKIRVYSF